MGAEETRALRSRIQLAEAAQKQARGMEMDYEEVIHLLEAEIAELKTQRAEQPAAANKVRMMWNVSGLVFLPIGPGCLSRLRD